MARYGDHIAIRIGPTICIVVLSSIASAQKPSAADLNKANNPLTPEITVNFQDQAQPLLYDLDQAQTRFFCAESCRTNWEGYTSSFATHYRWSRRRMETVAQQPGSVI